MHWPCLPNTETRVSLAHRYLLPVALAWVLLFAQWATLQHDTAHHVGQHAYTDACDAFLLHGNNTALTHNPVAVPIALRATERPVRMPAHIIPRQTPCAFQPRAPPSLS